MGGVVKALDIRGRLGLLFLAFILVVIIFAGTTFWGIESLKEDALFVNLAGRQHTLVQQMMRQALRIEILPTGETRLNLQESMHEFEQILLSLREGGSVPYSAGVRTYLPPTRDSQILEQLDRLSALWSNFRGYLQVVLAAEPSSQEFQDAVRSLENIYPDFDEQADVVVREYAAASSQEVERLRWIQIGFLSSALFLLALSGWIMHRSVIEPMNRLASAAQRIGDGDLSTKVQLTGPQDIQVLSNSLELMRTQLKSSQKASQAWTDALEMRVSQRTLELEALHTVMREISSRLEIRHVLSSVTEKARQLLGGDLAYLCLLDEDGQVLTLQATSGPVGAVEQPSTQANAVLPGKILSCRRAIMCGMEGCQGHCEIIAPLYRTSHIAAALHAGRRVIGALCVGSSQADFFSGDDLNMLTELADMAAIALENARLYEQAEYSAMLEERQRLAAEMHDGLAQSLSYLQVLVDLIHEQLESGKTKEALASLERSHQAIEQASQETRRAIASLQEEIPHISPLQEQLNDLVEELCQADARIAWAAQLKSPLLLPHEEAEQVLRVVREALLNACNHSHASHITVSLEHEDGRGIVHVNDDGLGFDPEGPHGENGRRHFGLSIMRARAARLGGQLEINSAPGSGTSICLIWSLNEHGDSHIVGANDANCASFACDARNGFDRRLA
jgi:two-component system, NarL family, nitrate/nitrite sensor histidine kinase NarX